MSNVNIPLGKIDCRGQTRSHPSAAGNTDQFLVAEVRPSLYIRESSLAIDDASRLFGGSHGLLLQVADGIGERESGQRASTVATDAVTQYLVNSFDMHHEMGPAAEQRMLHDLSQSLVDCRAQLTREVAASDRFESMATTLTMAYVMWPRTFVIHVGRNRAYHIRNGTLKRLTTDHTMAQKLQRAGVIGPSQAVRSDLRSVLWNVVGTSNHNCQPETFSLNLEVGDVLLLCSDGVTQTIEENRLLEAVNDSETAAETCERVLSASGDQRQDDATVVVARFLHQDQITSAAASSARLMNGNSEQRNRKGQLAAG